MATEEIVMKVNAEVKPAQKDFDDLGKSIEQVKENFDETNKSIKLQEKFINNLETELVRLEQRQNELGKNSWTNALEGNTKKIEKQKLAIKESKIALKGLNTERKDSSEIIKKNNKELAEQEKNIRNGIGNFSLMGVSINGLKKSFKGIIPAIKIMFGTIRAGIISTGIGALLVAFGSLVAFFTKTAEGAEKLRVAFSAIGAAIDVLVDRMSSLGKIISLVFSGDFSEAGDLFKETIANITSEIKAETAAAMKLQEALILLEKTERKFIKTKALANQEIAKARLIAKDENKSLEDRKAGLERAILLEEKILQEEIKNQTERVRIAKEQTGLSKSKEEDLAALQEQEVKLIELETKSFKKQKTLATELNRLNTKIAAEEKKIADDKIAFKKEIEQIQAEEDQLFLDNKKTFEDKLVQLQNATTLLLIEDEQERHEKQLELQLAAEIKSIEALTISEDQKLQLKKAANEKYAASLIKNDKAVAANQKDLQKAQINAALNFAGQLNSLAGESKAVSAGLALIDTFVAVQSVMADKSIPTTTLKLLTAGGILAQGLNNVKQIYSVDVGTGSGGSVPNVDSQTPAPEMLSGKFELGNAQTEQQPVQAYVVTDELTDNQNKLAYIRRRATI